MIDWNRKIGKRICVILEDGTKVCGKLYSITEDYWGKKIEKTMNVSMNHGKEMGHFPISKIKKKG